MNERLKVVDKGWVIVEYKDGKIESFPLKGDLVVNVGINFLLQRSYSNTPTKMTYGAVGTGTNIPLQGDTALQTELLRKVLTVLTNPTTGVAHFEFVIDFTEANGSTLSEMGIFNASAAGVMLLRKLFDTPISKTPDKKFTVIAEMYLETDEA